MSAKRLWIKRDERNHVAIIIDLEYVTTVYNSERLVHVNMISGKYSELTKDDGESLIRQWLEYRALKDGAR